MESSLLRLPMPEAPIAESVSRLFPPEGPRPHAGEVIAACVEAARGSLKLLAARQIPAELRVKVALSDVIQETALEAFSSADRFEGSTRQELFAWLRKILRNNVIDAVRRYRDCHARDCRREQPLQELSPRDHDDRSLVTDRRPELSAIRSERDQAVLMAIDSLPEPHATVIRLRIWDNLKFREIAHRCGRSEEAVRKLFFRSLVRLKEVLDEHPATGAERKSVAR